ncbi:MAG: hypothetical protein ACO3ZY_12565, partial [Phycisphaerales bacterium]
LVIEQDPCCDLGEDGEAGRRVGLVPRRPSAWRLVRGLVWTRGRRPRNLHRRLEPHRPDRAPADEAFEEHERAAAAGRDAADEERRVAVGGAFMLFEGLVGWCAVRAMGFKTPV